MDITFEVLAALGTHTYFIDIMELSATGNLAATGHRITIYTEQSLTTGGFYYTVIPMLPDDNLIYNARIVVAATM